MGDPRRQIVLALGALSAAVGCVSRQTIPLECVPQGVTIYVDGRELEEHPGELSLRTDQPHTVFFKGGGHPSQMVVLESREQDGETSLEPADVCTEVSFREMAPDVKVEVSPE